MADTNLGIIVRNKQKSYDFVDQFYTKTITIMIKNHMILIWISQRLNHMIVEAYNHTIIYLYHHMICMNKYHMKFIMYSSYDLTNIPSYEFPVESSYDIGKTLSDEHTCVHSYDFQIA